MSGRILFLPVFMVTLAAPIAAQTVPELVQRGAALVRHDPAAALSLFDEALRLDSLDYEANWRAAATLVELGQELPDRGDVPARDSSYAAAEDRARRAIAIDPERVDGHFVLAMALGRIALTRSGRDRVGYAVEIFEAASRAVAIDSSHSGAHHVLGLWHAEARRISGLSRFLARNLLGGAVLGQSSWDAAIRHLETAVRLDPTRIFHRLDLARVYCDRKHYSAARRELAVIAELPDRERLDPRYREEAERLREAMMDKRDRSDPPSPSDGGA